MTPPKPHAALAPTLAALAVLTGGIQLAHDATTAELDVVTVEVPFGALIAGSSAGANATNGSATVAKALVATTRDALYLNNTNATHAYYAKLEAWSITGLGGFTTLRVGIHNGTAATDQVIGSGGGITQASGDYVRLEPGSANLIYVTQRVGISFGAATINLDVRVADDLAESAVVKSRVTLTIA